MSQTTSFTNTSTEIGLSSVVRQAMILVRQRLDARRDRARVRFELSSYSDRELADMGMSRSDIEDVVHQR